MDKAIDKKALLDNKLLENLSDRQWMSVLQELPDPDPILRKANLDQAIYQEILGDPHVLGEVRKIYAALIGFKYEIKAGDESQSAQKSKELCEGLFKKAPHKTMRWPDLFWSMGRAPLTGRRVHHVTWQKEGSYLIPDQIFNISGSGYGFSQDGDLLIHTIDNPQGELAEDYRWLTTRHMPDAENPYGVAILSACFWPWMFKNGGIKFFAKFCEKFGIPWPVTKYPKGSTETDIDELVKRMQAMLEDAVAAIPDDATLELVQANASGTMPQGSLINLMNREMSKALTSQSLATEIVDGGSRAAAETGDKRTEENNKADRALIADTMKQLFEWITLVNFGPNIPPPQFNYVDKKLLNKDDVDWLAAATELVPVATKDIYKRLDLSEPKDGDEVVFKGSEEQEAVPQDAEFSAHFSSEESWQQEDQVIAGWIDQIKQAIDQGDTLEEALQSIVNLVPDLDIEMLAQITRPQLELEYGKGMLDA